MLALHLCSAVNPSDRMSAIEECHTVVFPQISAVVSILEGLLSRLEFPRDSDRLVFGRLDVQVDVEQVANIVSGPDADGVVDRLGVY